MYVLTFLYALRACCLWVGVRENGLGNIIFSVRGYYIFIDLSHLLPDVYNAWHEADACQDVQGISDDIGSAEAELFHFVLMLKHSAPPLGRYTGDNKIYMGCFIGKVRNTQEKSQENLSQRPELLPFFFFLLRAVKWLGTH